MHSMLDIMFDKIAQYLSKSSVNSDDHYPHYIGYLVILYDLVDFIPVVFISILLFHTIFYSFFFIVFLSILRQYTGGIHAPNAVLCSIFYSLLFIAFYQLTQVSLSIQMRVIITLLCDLFTIIGTCITASKSAYLSKSSFIYNRNMSIIVLINGQIWQETDLQRTYRKIEKTRFIINMFLLDHSDKCSANSTFSFPGNDFKKVDL